MIFMLGGQRDWLTFWERCQHRTYYWKIVVPGEFPFDMRRVHPWQQKYVSELYNIVKDIDTIDTLILFGSSVTPFCNMRSDLDIAYVGDLGEAYLPVISVCPNGVDLLRITEDTDAKLYENIMKGLRLI